MVGFLLVCLEVVLWILVLVVDLVMGEFFGVICINVCCDYVMCGLNWGLVRFWWLFDKDCMVLDNVIKD